MRSHYGRAIWKKRFILGALFLLASCRGTTPTVNSADQITSTPAPNGDGAAGEIAALEAKVAQFAPAELTADLSVLPESERKTLDRIVEAAKLLDPIFDRQHSLWPAFKTQNGKKVEVRIALGASASAFEEAKADVMGAYNVLFMIDKELFPAEFREQLLVSYFIGLFRSVRFGVAEAHGKGAALQINRYLEDGSATYDPATKRYAVDLEKLETSIETLVRDICLLQHHGNKPAVDAMLSKYGLLSDSMKEALGTLGGIPVDLRPIYPVAS